ncbi:hypothetical protein, partial [Coprobacter fastidiosus]|uniref:hypothetical protein n=1 Tax=Coprobacter fastidiosus TaxID=1099853 RepID=UPI0026666558
MLFTSCIIYVYQYNRIYIYLLKKQHRNKIGILGDSSIFTLHLISFFALGLTKMLLKAISPTIYTYRKNIVWLCIDELCSQKRKEQPRPKKYFAIGVFGPCKVNYFYQVIGIWKGKYAYL